MPQCTTDWPAGCSCRDYAAKKRDGNGYFPVETQLVCLRQLNQFKGLLVKQLIKIELNS
jgi:hypothetical protein